MALPEQYLNLTGEWKGTNRLHLNWMPDPILESDSTAVVRQLARGQCLEIVYTWSYKGELHEGILLLSGDAGTGAIRAVWTDSWHSANVIMVCDGSVRPDGGISVKGSYAVPDHPDRGWRTEIFLDDQDFNYVMYNISPEGLEELAVETRFSRIEAASPAASGGASP